MMGIFDFAKMKKKGEKIVMVTCYDYTSARLVNASAIDCVLVGDSAAMTMHGHADTLAADIPMMVMHTQAVRRGAPDKFIVGDLPFLSYRKTLGEAVEAAGALMRAGAHAVKLEGVTGNEGLIRHLVQSGIPVMGHIGLTPQFVYQLGGYRVQGKSEESAQRLKEEALQLQEAGCFALVLECVPAALAADISRSLDIAVIGIGAGAQTDGQVLVFQDMLGLNTAFKPRFVKHFADGATWVASALSAYAHDVKEGAFPDDDHHF